MDCDDGDRQTPSVSSAPQSSLGRAGRSSDTRIQPRHVASYAALVDIGAWTSTVAVAVVGALGAYAQTRRRVNPRDQIKSDIEIYKSLPEASAAGPALLARIDEQIRGLIVAEQVLRRDATGIVLGLFLLAGGVWTTAYVAWTGGLWRWAWVGTISLAVLGLVGLVESARKAERDSKGSRVQSSAVSERSSQ